MGIWNSFVDRLNLYQLYFPVEFLYPLPDDDNVRDFCWRGMTGKGHDSKEDGEIENDLKIA